MATKWAQNGVILVGLDLQQLIVQAIIGLYIQLSRPTLLTSLKCSQAMFYFWWWRWWGSGNSPIARGVLQKGPQQATKWAQNGVILVGLGLGSQEGWFNKFLVQKVHFWGAPTPSQNKSRLWAWWKDCTTCHFSHSHFGVVAGGKQCSQRQVSGTGLCFCVWFFVFVFAFFFFFLITWHRPLIGIRKNCHGKQNEK